MRLTYYDDDSNVKIENVRPKIEQICDLPRKTVRIVSESELQSDGIIFKTEIEFEDTKPCLPSMDFSSEIEAVNEPAKAISYECYVCGDGTYETDALLKSHMLLHYNKIPFKCQICSKTFSHRLDLTKHRQRAHSDAPKVRPTNVPVKKHRCTVCGYSANKKSRLTMHMRGHTGERNFPCTSCPKSFIYPTNLKRHMKQHTDFKLYKCDLCPKEYRDPFYVNRHKKIHHFNVKPLLKYKCSECDQARATPSAFKRHMASHSELKAFQCGICFRKYKSKSNLKLHEQRHQEKSFACSFCSGRFFTKADMKKHEMKHDGGRIKKVSRNFRTYQCYLCGYVAAKNTDSLVQHFIRHLANSSTEHPFKCNFCPKVYLQEISLRKHLRIHRNEKQFRCNICVKMFWQDDELQSHIRRVHTHEKPFKCYALCGRAFYDQADLHDHEMSHAIGKIRNVSLNLRTYQCYVCKCTIQRRHSVKKHLIMHSVRVPFECQICFKRFLNKACLQRHLRKHMGEKPEKFQCDICTRKFNDKSYLVKHMHRHSVRGPHWCSKCSLRFKSKDTLYNHNRKHLEKPSQPQKEKLYECRYCDFSAPMEESLIVHMQNHGLFLKCFVKIKKISSQTEKSVDTVGNVRGSMGEAAQSQNV